METIPEGSNDCFSVDNGQSIYTADDDMGNDQDEDEIGGHRPVLGKRETRAIYCLKGFVMFILLGCGLAIAACVYLYTSQQEQSTFDDSFADYSQQIIDTVDTYARNKLEALGALALMIQAHAITANETFPFVTVPFFEEIVQGTKSLTACYGIMLFPIVTEANRQAYVNYTLTQRGWINASYAAQREMHGSDNLGMTMNEISQVDWFDYLWTMDYYNESNPDFSAWIADDIFQTRSSPGIYHPVVETEPGPYFPQWQVAPLDSYYQSTVNLNYGAYDDFYRQTEIIHATSNAAFGIAWTDQSTDGYISTLLYPIFDQFHGSEKSIVAFLGLDIYWKAFLENILPPETKGIQVVVYNSCGQNFTFLLEGNNATFQGDGDLHDLSFDGMARSTVFGRKLMEPVTEEGYLGPPLYGDYCTSTFNIYPTRSMKDFFITDQPWVYAGCALAILLFTSAVFLLYDVFVERRQRLVLTTATRADKVVSSLFPEHVKEKLYETDNERTNKGFRRTNDIVHEPEVLNPIANLYPETTILFAGK